MTTSMLCIEQECAWKMGWHCILPSCNLLLEAASGRANSPTTVFCKRLARQDFTFRIICAHADPRLPGFFQGYPAQGTSMMPFNLQTQFGANVAAQKTHLRRTLHRSIATSQGPR